MKSRLTTRTKAIVPVHLYGHPPISSLCSRLRPPEGSKSSRIARLMGTQGQEGRGFGLFGCFSLPTKNLGSYGDGGMIVTGSADHRSIFACCGTMESEGASSTIFGASTAVWTNCRRPSCVSSFGISTLGTRSGTYLARCYDRASRVTGAKVPIERPDATHATAPMSSGSRRGIACGNGSPTTASTPAFNTRWPIHLQPAYRDLGAGLGSFPVAEQAASEILSLQSSLELRSRPSVTRSARLPPSREELACAD